MSRPAVGSHIFAGTADAYAQYRVPYPQALFDDLRVSVTTGRVLDLGCGTGEVALRLARDLSHVVAADPDPEMLAVGRRRAAEAEIRNVEWLESRAEDLDLEPRSFDLITIGSAFHWMDRARVAQRAATWLTPGGRLSVIGGNSPWNGDERWQRIAIAVVREWLGEERRAGSGTFASPRERHEDVLAAAGFTDVRRRDFPLRHTWTIATFTGYLRSTSFASSPQVLGTRAAAFERALEERLLEHDPRGRYTETIAFYSLVARAPEGAARG